MKKKSISLEDSVIDLYLKVKSAIYNNQKTTDLESIKRLNTVIIVDYISTLCNILIENSKFNLNNKISDSSNDLPMNLQSKKFSFNSLLNQINNNSQDEYSDVKADDNSLNINKRKSTFKHDKLDVVGEENQGLIHRNSTAKHFIIDSVTCSLFTGNNTNEDSINIKHAIDNDSKDKQGNNLHEIQKTNENENKILETISNFEATNDNNDNNENENNPDNNDNNEQDNYNNEVIENNDNNNENDISYQCSPEVYEKLLQEHESTIRNHIKLEHQLKLQNEAYVIKIEELERKIEKLNAQVPGFNQSNQKENPTKEINLTKKSSKIVDKIEEDSAVKINTLKNTISSLNKDIVNYKKANAILHKRINELEKKIKAQAVNYDKTIKGIQIEHKAVIDQLKSQIKIFEEKNFLSSNNNCNNSNFTANNLEKQHVLNIFNNCSSSTISKLSDEKLHLNNIINLNNTNTNNISNSNSNSNHNNINNNTNFNNNSNSNTNTNNTYNRKSIDNISVGLFNSTININMPYADKKKRVKLNKTNSDNFNNFNETHNNSINDSHHIELPFKLNSTCVLKDNKEGEKETTFANTTGLSSNKVNSSTINTSSVKESNHNNNIYNNSEYISISNNNLRNKDNLKYSMINNNNSSENCLSKTINKNNEINSILENELNLSTGIKVRLLI